MRLSKYSDYSLRVLMHAAVRQPKLATIDEVVGAFGISRNHLVKVVHALGRGGFLSTRRGIGGGFTLALPPEKIGVGDVVRLTEAGEKVIDCKDGSNRPCQLFPACRLKSVLGEAASAFFAVLDGYSLEDLVKHKSDMGKLLGI
jgi:Rrf2 family nitric oxide-sensitive transcriptional repressor